MQKIIPPILCALLLSSCAVSNAYHEDYPNGQGSPVRYLFFSNPSTAPAPTPPPPGPAPIEKAHML